RREMLLARKDAVREFFERTNVRAPARGKAGWFEAFRAVQRNDYLAECFVEEMRALIEYIEAEFGDPPRADSFHEEATAIKNPSLHPVPGGVPERIDDEEAALTTRHDRQATGPAPGASQAAEPVVAPSASAAAPSRPAEAVAPPSRVAASSKPGEPVAP